MTVHVDGGARGNPGPSAVAAVASDGSGQELAERSAYIGETTNNVAEYKAVLLGLELARELGAAQVDVVNDSELVSRQIEGRYKVKNAGLKPLYRETLESLRGFDGWTVTSVRRESNERADQLVNEALDRETGRG
ncbi:MAG TPA: ribonuclease HI family protein [Thermoleophilaceae bacterium]|nr:ribonuclease HI family protein [Thermoleophilaceae bacterium]